MLKLAYKHEKILNSYKVRIIIKIPIKPSNKPKIDINTPFLFLIILFKPKDALPIKEANDKIK